MTRVQMRARVLAGLVGGLPGDPLLLPAALVLFPPLTLWLPGLFFG
jgi:hypothetical protein